MKQDIDIVRPESYRHHQVRIDPDGQNSRSIREGI